MTAYEGVINYYASLHENYGWTKAEVDETELEYLLDLLIVRDKVEHAPKYAAIDEVI